ncbi:MAG: hypothetical protein GXO28_04940 [Methanopyri archaeon]|nr:hypothetical protein [Methanopyri archaeon]
MRILRDLIGKPVIDSTAKNVGEVQDVIMDEETGEVTHLVVADSRRPGVLRKLGGKLGKGGGEHEIHIPYSEVKAIDDAVLVEGKWAEEE